MRTVTKAAVGCATLFILAGCGIRQSPIYSFSAEVTPRRMIIENADVTIRTISGGWEFAGETELTEIEGRASGIFREDGVFVIEAGGRTYLGCVFRVTEFSGSELDPLLGPSLVSASDSLTDVSNRVVIERGAERYYGLLALFGVEEDAPPGTCQRL